MQWVLIIYFFIGGPGGGWFESQRIVYETEEICIEYRDVFNSMPKPGTLMARCERDDPASRG